jgi:hypothetical protein
MMRRGPIAAVALATAACSVPAPESKSTDEILARAFETRTSNLQVEGVGRVVRHLSDDNQGSRHQRFLLRLSGGQTLLIAHNIDVAPRLEQLDVGDEVRFRGEYEWNAQGGIIHWTHRDESGRHDAGWLEHAGRRYD